MKNMKRLLLSALALTLVLAGCGGGAAKQPETSVTGAPSTPTPAPSAPAPAAKETIKVSMAVGGKSSIIYLPPAIAEYNGFFKEEAIEVQVEDVKGGSQSAQALVSGQVDFASMAVEQAAKAKAQGVDLVMLVLYTRYPAATLIVDSKLKESVKSVNDLKGKKIGVTSIGSATHKAVLSLLEKHGMQATDVEIVGVGTADMPAALTSGKIQAAMGLDPWVTQLTRANQAYSLWDMRTKKDTEALYGGTYPFVGLVTRREVITKNPEMVQRVVNAVLKGNKFLASNGGAAVAAVVPAEFKGEDSQLYIESLQANLDSFAPDGIAAESGLQIVINSLKAEKVIPDNMTIRPADIFDPSFILKAK